MAYGFYKICTVNHLFVVADQVNFPVLVSITDPDLRTVANGGLVQNASGFDIVFSAALSSSPVLLNFQLESYDPVTGNVVAWVMLTGISSLVDVLFYLIFGNAAIVVSQMSSPFDADYRAVYHLASAGASNPDATAGNHPAVFISGPGAVAPVAGVPQLNGSGDFTNAFYGPSPAPGAFAQLPLTFQCWLKTPVAGLGAAFEGVMCWLDGGNALQYLILLDIGAGNARPAVVRNGIDLFPFTTIVIPPDTWCFLAVTWSAAGTFPTNCYMASVDLGTAGSELIAVTTGTMPGTSANWGFGARDAAPLLPFTGELDELRYSSIERSEPWILTEILSVAMWPNFVLIGATQAFAVPAALPGGSWRWFIDAETGLEVAL